jgi:deazaflavin-dependent oxidoreductase (nitroreductase family)
MPLPRAVARLNRVGLNRVTRHLAPWLPGFAVVHHRGRRSGTRYATPVNLFVRDGRYVVALTYGADADWVRNVLAAGECDVVHRNRRHHLVDPRLVHDESRADVPRPVRAVLGRLGVEDFLVLTP